MEGELLIHVQQLKGSYDLSGLQELSGNKDQRKRRHNRVTKRRQTYVNEAYDAMRHSLLLVVSRHRPGVHPRRRAAELPGVT